MVFQGSMYALRSLPRTPSAETQLQKQPEGDIVIKGNKSVLEVGKLHHTQNTNPCAYRPPFQCPEARKQPKQRVRQPWPI